MNERKPPLPRVVVYGAAVCMWPYFILCGFRELWRRLMRAIPGSRHEDP